MNAAQPFARTSSGDAYVAGSTGQSFKVAGFSLCAGADAATAVFTDANGVVLAKLGAGIGLSVNQPIPVQAVGKVAVVVTGTTPTAIAYIA